MLHTLYQQSLKARAEFFIEFFALDLLMDQDGTCCGVMAWDLSTGQLHRYRAKQVILATGGYGRAYFSATSRSEETTSDVQSLMRISYDLSCSKQTQRHT